MIKKKYVQKEHFRFTIRSLRFLISLFTFLFLSGIVYIPARRQLGYINESVIIKSYADSESSTGADRSIDILRAIEYNKKVAARHARETFFYRGASKEGDEYRSLLAGADGIMCVLEIPSIDICLPVGHGTSDEVLETMAGHVCGTSLPVGGQSTNAVIAAHSGSASARLFTDLGKMIPGDEAYVHIGSEVLTYRIRSEDDITIVLPFDGNMKHATSPGYDVPYFQVVPGEDILTLYTCTPLGINSHRLIIQCHRIMNEAGTTDRPHVLKLTERKLRSSFLGVFLMLIPLAGSIAIYRHT